MVCDFLCDSKRTLGKELSGEIALDSGTKLATIRLVTISPDIDLE
jgi:hypothetical protein